MDTWTALRSELRRVHRFFISPERIVGDTVEFPLDLSRQIGQVLRMREGDQIVALDGTGYEYSVSLSSVDSSCTRGRIAGRSVGTGEPEVQLILYQAAVSADRFEWVLQKGTELGVSSFVPVVTLRTLQRHATPSPTRRDRWLRIIREAAEQSGRSRLPELGSTTSLLDALTDADRPAIVAWEEESDRSLRSAFTETPESWRVEGRLSAFVGPVGGFATGEIDLARSMGAMTVSLGRRILRAETAAVVLVSMIMHELGELEP